MTTETMPTLTGLEIAALTDAAGALNLTAGPCQASADRAAIGNRPPAFRVFAEASRRSFTDVETEAHQAFFGAVGQIHAPIGTSVALMHPTFDDIADLFRARGLTLPPMAETDLVQQNWPHPRVNVIMIAHPNGPTGFVTPPGYLQSLAHHAPRHVRRS